MFKNIILVLLSIFIFNACITTEIPAYKTYNLQLLQEKHQDSNTINKSIQIDEPKALISLNSRAILYSKHILEQEEYLLSKWSDKPSRMLQKLISLELNNNNSFKLVTSSLIKFPSDYKVKTEILSFIHEFKDDKSYAKFLVKSILINNKTKDIKIKTFAYSILCEKNNAYSFVLNINKAANLFVKDLSFWLKENSL